MENRREEGACSNGRSFKGSLRAWIEPQNEKATRQLGGLFFQGRIVLTEGKVRQNFLAKSYGPKKGGVKRFFNIKCLVFQQLIKSNNVSEKCIKMRPMAAFRPLTFFS